MGLDNASDDATALFGQTFAPNDASQYFSRLVPNRGAPRPETSQRAGSRSVDLGGAAATVIHQSKDGLVVQLRDRRKLAPPSMPWIERSARSMRWMRT
jgi:hypothetical protein